MGEMVRPHFFIGQANYLPTDKKQNDNTSLSRRKIMNNNAISMK